MRLFGFFLPDEQPNLAILSHCLFFCFFFCLQVVSREGSAATMASTADGSARSSASTLSTQPTESVRGATQAPSQHVLRLHDFHVLRPAGKVSLFANGGTNLHTRVGLMLVWGGGGIFSVWPSPKTLQYDSVNGIMSIMF